MTVADDSQNLNDEKAKDFDKKIQTNRETDK